MNSGKTTGKATGDNKRFNILGTKLTNKLDLPGTRATGNLNILFMESGQQAENTSEFLS
ncbi:hypothetical protein GCM10023116_49630 [Kistimonas scapharcae]|uniref:Uncharacterized protein n=1 Tax=Kistimonas scapharcae TaxID=1036133 RepID=A0ABP8VBB2_9GAMM